MYTKLREDRCLTHIGREGNGKPKSTDFSTEARYTNYHSSDDNVLWNALLQTDASTSTTTLPKEHDEATSHAPTWILQSDYTRPVAKHTKLEAGIKATLRNSSNDFAAAYFDTATRTYIAAPGRTSTFSYQERIGAAYTVLSQTLGRLDAQAGLRLEQASTRLDLPAQQQGYRNDYGSLFPSGILAYHLTDMRQVKLSYSRRITRPDPVQLSPYVYQDQPRNVFQGNPTLRPEYTDAMELGLQDTHTWGSVQLTPFVRHTAHAVRYIRRVDSSGVTHGTFENVASTLYAGANLNVTYHTGKLNIFGGASAYRFNSDAANLPADLSDNLSVHSFGWSTRANATWNFTSTTDGQIFANYLAPMAAEGGTQTAFVLMNLALRHKLWKGQGSVTLRIADPFNMTRYGFRTQDGRVSELTLQNFGLRGVFLNFSRNFGQQLKLRPRQEDDPTPTSRPVGP